MAMNDQHKAFFLSVALGCFEAVRNEEERGTTRFRRLDNAMDNCLKAVDLYLPQAFSGEDCDKATVVLDEINERIRELYQ